ncbi:MAG: hypothetical protein K8S99_04275 [Planctomycetes bacterium]|nr:hypothetical protein [Planctomycetota bacterium]
MAGKKRDTLRAGAATADITPELGIQLAGDIGRLRPVEEIREKLYARALVLESGKTRCCLVVMDLCVFANNWSDEIRRRASERTGIPVEAIALMATQTHSAPSLGNNFIRDSCELMPQGWLRGGDDRYNEPTVTAIVDAIARAAAACVPVSVSVGRAMDGRVAFNRRFVMRDGTAVCHPASCDPRILHVEGPTDPEVGVLTLSPGSGPPLAALLHHTCHPCHGYPERFTLADWPGVWSDEFRQRHGQSIVPLVVNGCCGNIHHAQHVNPDYKRDHVQMARMLADTSDRVMKSMTAVTGTPLAFRRGVLKLPMRSVPAKELAAAKKLIRKHPDPVWLDEERTRVSWDWVYAVSTIDLDRWVREEKTFDYEIQTFRIGDAAFVTVMGEPFVECQLDIKLRSPAPFTFVGHMANGYAGYIPTPGAIKRGGYETRTSQWSKFRPEALQQISDRAVKLLRDLF